MDTSEYLDAAARHLFAACKYLDEAAAGSLIMALKLSTIEHQDELERIARKVRSLALDPTETVYETNEDRPS